MLAFAMVLLFCGSACAAPALSSPKVTPATGRAGGSFTFTVRYAGEEPASVRLFFVGQEGRDMLEVDPSDRNFTDGKDYYLVIQLAEGTTIYHFKAFLESGEEASTPALTVSVAPAPGVRMDHLDVVFAVLIFLIPAIWGLIMFRRFSRDMRGILESIRRDQEKESE